MSGIGGGWLTWVLATGLLMAGVCFMLSLGTRRFLAGAPMVLVTVFLTLVLVVFASSSGMARIDFTLGFVLPYFMLTIVIAVVWLIGIKVRALSTGTDKLTGRGP